MRIIAFLVLILLSQMSFGQTDAKKVRSLAELTANTQDAPSILECGCKLQKAIKLTSKSTEGYVSVYRNALIFRFGDYIREFQKVEDYEGVYRDRKGDIFLVERNRDGVNYMNITSKTRYFILDQPYVITSENDK